MAGLETDTAIFAGLAESKKNDFEYEKEQHSTSVDHVTESSDHELDGIHDGLEFPTEEEKLTLRRVSDTIPWNAYCESRTSSHFFSLKSVTHSYLE